MAFNNATYADVLFGKFKKGSEPSGFRDIKWGTHFNKLKDMHKCELFAKINSTLCLRIGDNNSIGSAKLVFIKYAFFNNKFYQAWIRFIEEEDYYYLVSIMTDRYGIPFKVEDKMSLNSLWMGDNTDITISYYKDKGYGGMMINSSIILREMEKDRNKRADGDF
jgi:hypothetical protein